jgi:hypothetical protein
MANLKKNIWLIMGIVGLGNIYQSKPQTKKVESEKPVEKPQKKPSVDSSSQEKKNIKDDLIKKFPGKPFDINEAFAKHDNANIALAFLKECIKSNFYSKNPVNLHVNLEISSKQISHFGLNINDNFEITSVFDKKYDFGFDLKPFTSKLSFPSTYFFSQFLFSPIMKSHYRFIEDTNGKIFHNINQTVLLKYLLTIIEFFLDDVKTFNDLSLDIETIYDKIMGYMALFQQNEMNPSRIFFSRIPNYIITNIMETFLNVFLKNVAMELDDKGFKQFLENNNNFEKITIKTINKQIINFIAEVYVNKNIKNVNELIKKIITKAPVLIFNLTKDKDKEKTVLEIKNLLSQKNIQSFIKEIDDKLKKSDKDKMTKENQEKIQEKIIKVLYGDINEIKTHILKNYQTNHQIINATYLSDSQWEILEFQPADSDFFVFYSNKDLSTGKPGEFIYILPKINQNLIKLFGKMNILINNGLALPAITKNPTDLDKKIITVFFIYKLLSLSEIGKPSNDPQNSSNSLSELKKNMHYSVEILNKQTNQVSDNLYLVDNRKQIMENLQNNPFFKYVLENISIITAKKGPGMMGPGFKNPAGNMDDSMEDDGQFNDTFEEE